MAYVQRKLNASRYDLSPEAFTDFMECWDIIQKQELSRTIREGVVVQLLQDFDKDKLLEGIRGLIGRANFSPDVLQGLIDGSIPRERAKPMASNYNSSTSQYRDKKQESKSDAKSLRSILEGMPVVKDSLPPKEPIKYYNEHDSIAWMIESGNADKDRSHYFQERGINQNCETVYVRRKD